ncbi:MAG: hypothetical protein ACKVQA_13505 [Burkholderiales bacterium]
MHRSTGKPARPAARQSIPEIANRQSQSIAPAIDPIIHLGANGASLFETVLSDDFSQPKVRNDHNDHHQNQVSGPLDPKIPLQVPIRAGQQFSRTSLPFSLCLRTAIGA